MGQQLPLAEWAAPLSQGTGPVDARDELAAIEVAKDMALGEIRDVLDLVAERFGISGHEVTLAMAGVGAAVEELLDQRKSELERQR